jgi:hypothetical protein
MNSLEHYPINGSVQPKINLTKNSQIQVSSRMTKWLFVVLGIRISLIILSVMLLIPILFIIFKHLPEDLSFIMYVVCMLLMTIFSMIWVIVCYIIIVFFTYMLSCGNYEHIHSIASDLESGMSRSPSCDCPLWCLFRFSNCNIECDGCDGLDCDGCDLDCDF